MRGNHPCNATAPLNLACRLNEEDYFQYPFAHAAVTAFPYLTLGKEEKSLQNEESWQHCVLAPNQISHALLSLVYQKLPSQQKWLKILCRAPLVFGFISISKGRRCE